MQTASGKPETRNPHPLSYERGIPVSCERGDPVNPQSECREFSGEALKVVEEYKEKFPEVLAGLATVADSRELDPLAVCQVLPSRSAPNAVYVYGTKNLISEGIAGTERT